MSRAGSTAPSVLDKSRIDASLEDKCQLIESTAWSRYFSFAYIQCLADHMTLHQLSKGVKCFSEGDKGSYFILVIEGRMDVLKSDEQGKQKKVATLRTGNTIGEMSVVDQEPRSASVVAATNISILVMTIESFGELSKTRPRVALKLLMKFAKQMSQHLRLTSGRLVDHLE